MIFISHRGKSSDLPEKIGGFPPVLLLFASSVELMFHPKDRVTVRYPILEILKAETQKEMRRSEPVAMLATIDSQNLEQKINFVTKN